MDFYIFIVFQPIAIIILFDVQIVPFLASQSSLKLVSVTCWQVPLNFDGFLAF